MAWLTPSAVSGTVASPARALTVTATGSAAASAVGGLSRRARRGEQQARGERRPAPPAAPRRARRWGGISVHTGSFVGHHSAPPGRCGVASPTRASRRRAGLMDGVLASFRRACRRPPETQRLPVALGRLSAPRAASHRRIRIPRRSWRVQGRPGTGRVRCRPGGDHAPGPACGSRTHRSPASGASTAVAPVGRLRVAAGSPCAGAIRMP